MKYSFLIPYHKRDTLRRTFESFEKFYSDRKDYEVILVETKRTCDDAFEHSKLLSIINDFKDKIDIKHFQNEDMGHSCSRGYNIAFYNSSGEYVIITNPESPHTVDILKGFDELFEQDKNFYVVCGCEAVHPDGRHHAWYQHTAYSNRKLHFCSSMSRQNWLKINGFCEEYMKGCAFEDDDFLARVRQLGIPIVTRDDLMVLHIEHDRTYIYGNMELDAINRKVYNFIWDGNR